MLMRVRQLSIKDGIFFTSTHLRKKKATSFNRELMNAHKRLMTCKATVGG
jgi:hypothetical protein